MNISYQKYGQSENTILLVHGFMSDSRVFNRLIPYLLPYFQIISVDLPGYSVKDFSNKYYSLAAQAEQLFELVLSLQLEKIHYVGHSMGGYIGLEFLDQFPEKLGSFCLLNSHPYTDSSERTTNRQKTITFIEKYGSAPYVKQSFKTLFSNSFKEKNPQIVEELMARAIAYPPQTLIDSCRAMIDRKDHSQTLKNSSVPLLYFVGENDSLIDMATNQSVFELTPNAKTFIAADCGHMGMLEATQSLANFLIENIR